MAFTRTLRNFIAAVPLCVALGCGVAAGQSAVVAAPTVDNQRQTGPLQKAVLAGGCFWGMQGVFEHVRGVHEVIAGYAGGAQRTAQYEEVSTGRTGHAESVQIAFDPAEVTYGQLLRIYFSVAHDPTELNRQGPDAGTQYRSAIFYADDTQKRIAESYIAQLNGARAFAQPIVTRVETLQGFYPAESYHQDYYLRNSDNPYIVFNDLPKIRHLQQLMPEFWRGAPATFAAR